jgi:hypothetical protein
MKIERNILVFEKSGDEKLLEEINADKLTIDILKTIIVPLNDDPNFYRPYNIEELQYAVIVKHIPELKAYPCNEFYLSLDACTV